MTLQQPPNETSHVKFLQLVKKYIVLGGMPEVHEDYLVNQDLQNCQSIHTSLLNTYRRDLGKYASHNIHEYLQVVFTKSPQLIGRQIKYVDLDRDMRSRSLKKAIDLLEHAGVVRRVFGTEASGIPLNDNLVEKKFKTWRENFTKNFTTT